jgi:enoyl-CoA hydratase/carnithine racemase
MFWNIQEPLLKPCPSEHAMDYTTILYETSADHVATITLNRPEALNTFNPQMRRDFDHVWARIRDDETVHAVVLRAAPGKAFSTGADVRGGHSVEEIMLANQTWNQSDPGESLGAKMNKVWKPVVTAVHGWCCAGAFYWLNESDIIICSDDAQFFDPHVSYGMVCAVEPVGLRWRLPLGDVLRMSLLGNDERISPQTALRIGLVSEVVARDELWARAHQLAAQIAAKPPTAIQGTVRAIWESLELPRTPGIIQALKYPLVGNPVAATEIDAEAMRAASKSYETR